jgi:hypothetical protein
MAESLKTPACSPYRSCQDHHRAHRLGQAAPPDFPCHGELNLSRAAASRSQTQTDRPWLMSTVMLTSAMLKLLGSPRLMKLGA